ncbi:unnamed protein product [Linum tenue]|uniref:Uncharacterized protein n=1 Tax=Linum tenue TaxID=586396 RepID=A0AAV0M8N7_9ROSI|nr:unnamed protein product [Linum tenue]
MRGQGFPTEERNRIPTSALVFNLVVLCAFFLLRRRLDNLLLEHNGEIQVLLEFMDGGSLEGIRIANEADFVGCRSSNLERDCLPPPPQDRPPRHQALQSADRFQQARQDFRFRGRLGELDVAAAGGSRDCFRGSSGISFACCLQREPGRRWTAVQLLNHPFIVRGNGGRRDGSQNLHQLLGGK